MHTTFRRAFTVLAPAGLVAVLATGSASAHVTVSSPDAARGGYGKLVFRVPNESDAATTTKLQVTLPPDAPFSSVRPRPHSGWQVRVHEVKLPEPVKVGDLTLTEAVRTVTWTARGDGIGVDMFDEFELSVGPFPEEATTLMFPAVQTYSDGEVVRWNQPMPENGAEPEHPAPMLDLTTQDAASSHGSETDEDAEMAVSASESDASDADSSDDDSDPVARTLAAGGLVAGVAALGGTLLRRRREGGD